MGTSTLRFAIIIAFAIGAVVLIAQLPESSTSPLPDGGSPRPSESVSSSPTGQTNTGGEDGQGTQKAQVKGVKIAVYNGTYQTGLASETALKLEQRYQYKIDPKTSILDAEHKPWVQTTLYYMTPADKIEAEALANDFFFKKLDVKIAQLPQDYKVPAGVQVAIYLGTDYALLK